MKERRPDDEEKADIGELVADAYEYLFSTLESFNEKFDKSYYSDHNYSGKIHSEFLVSAIRSYVDAIHSGIELKPGFDDLGQAAYALGSLWGEEICRSCGWEWVYLEYDNGYEGWAVASPNRSHMSFPHHFIHEKLTTPEGDNTVALLFNMIKEGKMPSEPPKKYSNLY